MRRCWNAWRIVGALSLCPSLLGAVGLLAEPCSRALGAIAGACFHLFGPPLTMLGVVLLITGRRLTAHSAVVIAVITSLWLFVVLASLLVPVVRE